MNRYYTVHMSDRVLYSPALRELLLCSSRVVNRIQLYTALCCFSDLLYCYCVVTMIQLVTGLLFRVDLTLSVCRHLLIPLVRVVL
jgi:hypothetical protein